MRSSNEKGQLFTTDFVFASAMFLAALIIVYGYSNLASMRINELQIIQDREYAARRTAQMLVTSEGIPRNWHALADENIKSIGFALEPNILSEEKIKRFKKLSDENYAFLRDILGLQKYGISIKVISTSGNTLYSVGPQKTQESAIAKVSRAGLLNNAIVFLDVEVFE
ncbi:MAG: hypothetical protein N3F05_02235 [Candidatus Diapherotrites archaeon]|nr:hypothetical protein [Candidatus Diapherotrites archaeon]